MIIVLKRFIRTESQKFQAKNKTLVEQIEALEPTIKQLTDEQLKNKTTEFKERLHAGETLDDLLVEAFAVCREASVRVLGMRHFAVQLLGGIALHQGKAAEMKTGEGKTLVATLPTYLNALAGEGVHVVTVNDYLTERDHNLNQPLYEFLGLTSGFVTQTMTPQQKKNAYYRDITYVVNTQLGFDYLNDNRVLHPGARLLRGLNYCIIDEVDSILLDEARTPLIISSPIDEVSSWLPIIDILVKNLKKDEFEVDIRSVSGRLTDKGTDRIEKILNIQNLMDVKHSEINHIISQSLLANYVYRKDKHYLVRNDMVELIDENTGRVTEGRRYSNGLHQAIEAKEGVTIQKETITLASITYQYLFRYYNKISGMTGTAMTDEEEFWEVYRLPVVEIPTNVPVQRDDHADMVYATKESKLLGILKDIRASYEKGQPVLIGVSTIEQSEEVHRLLKENKIPHELLNAKNHEREAQIIAQAGQMHAITVATNMAGRGTDIKLGEGVPEVGGLKVIGTERNINRRVDNQLRGRSGRQGDVGESRFHVSLDDELMQVFASDRMKEIIETLGATAGGENGVVENTILSSFIARTQMTLEGQHFDARKDTIEFDAILSLQREIIYDQRLQVLTSDVSVQDLMRGQPISVVNSLLKDAFQKTKVISDDAFKNLVETLHQAYTKDIGDESMYFDGMDDNVRKTEENVRRALQTPLEELVEQRILEYEQADDVARFDMRKDLLLVVDHYWQRHLIATEEIKDGIYLVSYIGKEPVEEFFTETTIAYERMVENIQEDMLKTFLHTKHFMRVERPLEAIAE